MTPNQPAYNFNPVLQLLPVAFGFSSKILLPEKTQAMIESGLVDGEIEPLTPIQIRPATNLKTTPDPGWSHYGIND